MTETMNISRRNGPCRFPIKDVDSISYINHSNSWRINSLLKIHRARATDRWGAIINTCEFIIWINEYKDMFAL